MKTDGQLYNEKNVSPPPSGHTEVCNKKPLSLGRDELLILGIILLLTTDRRKADMPLVAALIYILL